MKPGDVVKIKLGGDVHEAKVINCRNKKTIWVEVLWNKTRIHALTPKEKKAVAEQKLSLDGLSEQEKALAMLAQQDKKVVHQRGTRRIKIPRAKVMNAEPFKPQLKKAAESSKPKALSSGSQQPHQWNDTIQQMVETAEDSMQTSPIEREEQEASEPRQLSKLEQMKARIEAKRKPVFHAKCE